MKKINLIAGLPRSGSSLLVNVLNSNPNFHSTPTSGVMDVLNGIRSTFSHNISFKAQDRMMLTDDIAASMRGFLNGYFEYKGDVIFDKSRGWVSQLRLLDEILGHQDTKIIWCYRDPKMIVNSIENQYHKTILFENMDELNAPESFKVFEDRIQMHYGLIDGPVKMLLDAIDFGYGDRIIIVPYDSLCSRPQVMLNEIHQFIGEEEYQYDVDNVKQSVFEWDGVYNYKFPHNIKEGKIVESNPKIVYPNRYFNIIEERYQNLYNIINKK